MRVIVVGGGPVGMCCAMALARRDDKVTVVDRDAGPPESGPWARHGVMQFHRRSLCGHQPTTRSRTCGTPPAGWRPSYADGPTRDELAAALAGPAFATD